MAEPVTCTVIDETAIYGARSLVRSFAPALGFDREVVEELVVVVSELTSNILKYGRRGRIVLAALDEDGARGITIAAEDETPAFDLDCALLDGHDAHGKLDPAQVYGRRGIGAGLGAVARLSDRVALEPLPNGGKRIVVRRVVSRARRGSSPGY